MVIFILIKILFSIGTYDFDAHILGFNDIQLTKYCIFERSCLNKLLIGIHWKTLFVFCVIRLAKGTGVNTMSELSIKEFVSVHR